MFTEKKFFFCLFLVKFVFYYYRFERKKKLVIGRLIVWFNNLFKFF